MVASSILSRPGATALIRDGAHHAPFRQRAPVMVLIAMDLPRLKWKNEPLVITSQGSCRHVKKETKT
jgi:hypothetical protein